ncbi:Zinc finger protein ZAT4 [Morella rubra]|uniref:Zinc finger protein ZAT4 n=1 Tax=Morella rubra TaxID=262757 RepID=A0A6A1VFK0_9ROSI|nr:Zinc finger protein ZAT4 [Morella rubra]
MGQDQEQRHLCKLCNQSFVSGKVLGGHMRCHTSKKSAKGRKKGIKSEMGFEGCGHTGYGLRENPKKSWKFSRSGHGASEQELVCKMCDRAFESLKALFGHMRHHSGRRRSGLHCRECGKGFGSVGALTTHKRSHCERFEVCIESSTTSSQKMDMDNQSYGESLGLVRRKRSNRMRYKIRPNSSFSSLNESLCFGEIEQEVAEVAMCLVMLSEGVRNWDGFCSLTEYSDNDSETVEVKSSGQNKRIANDNEDGIFALEGDDSCKMKKRRVEDSDSGVSHSKTVLAEKTVYEFSENDSGFGISEEKKVELEIPVDKFYGDAGCRIPKPDDVSGDEMEKDNHSKVKIEHTEVELDQDFAEGDGFNPANSGSTKSASTNKARPDACHAQLRGKSCKQTCATSADLGIVSSSSKITKYKCKICDKNFHSHHALGGHQSIHRTKNCSELKIHSCEESSQRDIIPETEAKCKLVSIEFGENSVEQEKSVSKETKEHKCHVCFKVFASGQALGGHKRVHSLKSSETLAEETLVIKQQISAISDLVDLNLPVIPEGETNVDVGIKSWWVGNGQKPELMVGLIPN